MLCMLEQHEDTILSRISAVLVNVFVENNINRNSRGIEA